MTTKTTSSGYVGDMRPAERADQPPPRLARTLSEWRLSVSFMQGVSELILTFTTREAALKSALAIISQGYVEQDRQKDPSIYDTVIYPIQQVRTMYVFEKK